MTSPIEWPHVAGRRAIGLRAIAACASIAAWVLSFVVLAQDARSPGDEPRLYAGVGAADLELAAAHAGTRIRDSSLGLGVHGGFKLRERLAIEVSYGSADAVELDDVWGSGTTRFDVASDWSTLAVRAVGELSLQEWLRWRRNWRLYGALGGYESRVTHRVTTRGTSVTERVRDDEAGLMLGTGVLYAVGPVDLRAYVEWYGVLDELEARATGVAVQWRF